jgi:DNA excision repair protein ERCC-2
MGEVSISVRGLVEYVYRSGDMDIRFRSSRSLTDGTKVHQRVQKTYKEADRNEVPLKVAVNYKDIDFRVEGRCDGLLITDAGVMIDEIKSTRHDIQSINEDDQPVHWAQAKIYAFIYSKDNELTDISVQLTYVQVDTENEIRFQRTFTYQELEAFFYEMLEGFFPYATYLVEHEREKIESSQALVFPFQNYRKGQRDLAGAVYKTIDEGANLFASAPTGIGKTISTTFPAIKAMGEGKIERLFYLTAKTITREAAQEAFKLMESQGLALKVVTLTAKEKICFQEEIKCQPDVCPFAAGYYDRINDAVLDILTHENNMDRTTIETYARKHRVCPFEFSLDVANACDVIICDYNYLFDPRVALKRFWEEDKKKTVVLVDEAHNLVDRAREMFSAELLKSSFLEIRRTYKEKNRGLSNAAKHVNDHLLALKKENQITVKELDNKLIEKLETFTENAEEALLQSSDAQLQEVYFAALHVLRIGKFYDERFVTYLEVNRSEVRWKLFCVDPSFLLQQTAKRFRSVIYFSATLLPFDYFKEMLGMTPDDYALKLTSPFNRENVKVLIKPLSTKYRDRERTLDAMVRSMHDLLKVHPGQYLFFFPSYQYMMMAYECFVEMDSGIPTIVQDKGMTEPEREEFLASFKEDHDTTLVGFAVLGGIFSEGIDLRGNRLNGVVVVGVGLPQIGGERDIIKDFYNTQGKNGFDYAYVFPGVNKVVQAGGRLIRSETDHGVIMLMDDRFFTRKYQSLLPFEWHHFEVLT